MSRSASAFAVILIWLCLPGLVSRVEAQTENEPVQFAIPAGTLADALDKLGEQSGLQLMYEPDLVKGIQVSAVRGTLTVRDALARLLARTTLKVDRVNDRTVVLRSY